MFTKQLKKSKFPNRDPVTGRFVTTKKKDFTKGVNDLVWFMLVLLTIFYAAMMVMLFLITQSLLHIESNHMYGPATVYLPEVVTELVGPQAPVIEVTRVPEEVQEKPRPLIRVFRGSSVTEE